MKHFGAILKKHIETNGLKKGDIAQGAGITYNYLSNIFNKESIDAKLMEKLCIVAGLSPMLVFEGVPYPQKINSDNHAEAILGAASISFGANEALYKALLDEKERYIKSLEAQIAELKGTKTEQ